jgi:hypothetical protein
MAEIVHRVYIEKIRASVDASNLFREALGGHFVIGADVE